MNGRFLTLRALGAGAMGTVVLAHDAVMERPVALKRARVPTGESLLRFKREFRAVAELRHPNLVRLYELGVDDEGHFFTM